MKNLALVSASVFVLAACSQQGSQQSEISGRSSSAMKNATSSVSSAMAPSSASRTSASFSAPSSSMNKSVSQTQSRLIDMTVENFAFVPSVINVRKGEKVTIRIKGVSGLHSFGVADLGLNVKVNPGETVDIDLPTDTTGTFTFRCMIPCGSGHKSMVGTITIS